LYWQSERSLKETWIVPEHPNPDRPVGPRRWSCRAWGRPREGGLRQSHRGDGHRAFCGFCLAPSQLEYTRDEYKRHTDAYAEKTLGAVVAAAERAGIACETLHLEREQVYEAIIDTGHGEGLLLDRDGLARAARRLGGCSWQRDSKGSHPFENCGPCRSLSSRPFPSACGRRPRRQAKMPKSKAASRSRIR